MFTGKLDETCIGKKYPSFNISEKCEIVYESPVTILLLLINHINERYFKFFIYFFMIT